MNLTAVRYPDGTKETFKYDANGNNIEATTRSGQTISCEYDKLNRITQIEYPNGSTETIQYDEIGRITKTTNRSGSETHYKYNAIGKNTSNRCTRNQTKFKYNILGQLTEITDALENTYKLEYDVNGNQEN